MKMIGIKVFCLLSTLLCASSRKLEGGTESSSAKDCIVPFGSRTEWSTFWPMVYHENGTFYMTSEIDGESAVIVPHEASVILSCGPNFLKKYPTKNFIAASCKENGKFLTENDFELTKIKNLGCDLRNIEEVVVPVEGCPRELMSVKFGYVNPVDDSAYITGEACYCQTEGRTLFAHVRTGDIIDSALEVQTKNFFNQRHPESKYKVDFMKAFRLDEFNNRMRSALDKSQVPEFGMQNFVDEKLLSNHQLRSTTKLAWNYYVLHDDILNLALLKEDIFNLGKSNDVYIGSHGVTTAKHADGSDVPIYLDEERFPIPELVWIVVKNENEAAAFAVFNDPELTAADIENKSFCESKCDQITWLNRLSKNEEYKNLRNGAVLCCEYNDFKKTVKEMPELEQVTEFYV